MVSQTVEAVAGAAPSGDDVEHEDFGGHDPFAVPSLRMEGFDGGNEARTHLPLLEDGGGFDPLDDVGIAFDDPFDVVGERSQGIDDSTGLPSEKSVHDNAPWQDDARRLTPTERSTGTRRRNSGKNAVKAFRRSDAGEPHRRSGHRRHRKPRGLSANSAEDVRCDDASDKSKFKDDATVLQPLLLYTRSWYVVRNVIQQHRISLRSDRIAIQIIQYYIN